METHPRLAYFTAVWRLISGAMFSLLVILPLGYCIVEITVCWVSHYVLRVKDNILVILSSANASTPPSFSNGNIYKDK